MSALPEAKKSRIQKACDNCRAKKIKCDGNMLCKNCANYRVTCTYNHVPKKRTVKPKAAHVTKPEIPMKRISSTNGSASLSAHDSPNNDLESKMARLETMMTRLTDLVARSTSHASVLNLTQATPSTVPQATPEVIQTPTPLATQPPSIRDEKFIKSRISQTEVNESQEADKSNSVLLDVEKTQHFFGSHSSFSIFSPRGMKWIASKSGNLRLMMFFHKLNYHQRQAHLSDYKSWTEPLDSRDLFPLPPFELYKFFVRTLFSTAIYLEVDLKYDEVVDLHRKHEEGIITPAEGLILSVVCCLGAHLLTDFSGSVPDFQPLADKYKLDGNTMRKLEDDIFHNCVHYYYRISVMGGGLSAITALLLFLSYIDISFKTMAQYMIVSTLIRLAQEAGLHRYESYIGLDSKEGYKRLVLFWQCYIQDKSTSLKSGKPPILRDDDISSISTELFGGYWYNNIENDNCHSFCFQIHEYLEHVSKTSGPRPLLEKKMQRLAYKRVIEEKMRSTDTTEHAELSFRFYYSELMELSSKAYNVLFSARALIGKSPLDIQMIVSSLNEELAYWFSTLPDALKIDPASHTTVVPQFFAFAEETPQEALFCPSMLIQFQYYYIIMIINRMSSSKTVWAPNNDYDKDHTLSNSVDLCLESARIIIKLSISLDNVKTTVIRFFFLFPFCAFITLFCSSLQDMTESNVKEDLLLMVKTADLFSFIGIKYNSSKLSQLNNLVTYMTVLVIDKYEREYPGDKTFEFTHSKESFSKIYKDIEEFVHNSTAKKKSTVHHPKKGQHVPHPSPGQNGSPAAHAHPPTDDNSKVRPGLSNGLFVDEPSPNFPMLNVESGTSTNDSPTSSIVAAQLTNALFNDLDPLLTDSMDQSNVFNWNQNAFSLPNFMIDGTFNGGVNYNGDINFMEL